VATYKDIQELTGLSLATISKYFNGKNLREPNRHAIERAVHDLDYRVNSFAQNLRSGKSGIVGVLVPSLENEFHMSIVAGVERRLRSRGLSVIVASLVGQTDAHRSIDSLLSRMVDAIIAVPSDESVDGIRRATQAGVPVIGFDWTADQLDIDSVTIDNLAAGRLAASHLMDHGHTRAALIGGPDRISTVRDRGSGFREHFRARGIELNPTWITSGALTVESGQDAMTNLLASQHRPTAAFSVNAELTEGALLAINQSGLQLGTDISLIGFDNIYAARLVKPPLTVIGQPIDAICASIEAIVTARIEPSSAPPTRTNEVLGARIVAGNSVSSRR
jgi:DNA-binding LacI/PurR family transcriptional regulator